MRLIPIVLLLFLAGCAVWGKTEVIRLANPESGDTVECGPYAHKGDVDKMLALSRLRRCVEEHEAKGYERVVEPRTLEPEEESGGY